MIFGPKKKTRLNQEYLHSILRYNLETGLFEWMVSRSGIKRKMAGHHRSDGYHSIVIDGKEYLSHRLAFLYVNGMWPKEEVDHINGIKDDNRWENLRECTKSQNGANRGLQENNTSGYRGVYWHKTKKKWRAVIRKQGKRYYLGEFFCPKVAAKVYNAAAIKHHGPFAYLNDVRE